jgi:protein-tyrosine phosphatase
MSSPQPARERRLVMQGTPNFRDFGGYSTASGQRVKWGYLYRSGALSRLHPEDVSLLGSLELDFICDFRQLEEQSESPSVLPDESPPRVLSLPIIPGSNSRFFEQAGQGQVGRQAMFDFMVEINVDFALAQTAVYASMFEQILAVDDARFLVHCAAGKDRTGFAAAIILLALGVPEEVVIHDYLMTADYFLPHLELDRIREKYQLDLPAEAVLPILEVHRDYIEAALSAIAGRYDSIADYLASELGLGPAELAELRARYLS